MTAAVQDDGEHPAEKLAQLDTDDDVEVELSNGDVLHVHIVEHEYEEPDYTAGSVYVVGELDRSHHDIPGDYPGLGVSFSANTKSSLSKSEWKTLTASVYDPDVAADGEIVEDKYRALGTVKAVEQEGSA